MKANLHIMRGLRHAQWIISSVLLIGIVGASVSHAELYFGGSVGGNFPFELSDVQVKLAGQTAQESDISLENSFAYGGKIGYFLSSFKWLGFEIEAFDSNPNIADQNIGIEGLPLDLGGADLRVVTAAFNVIGRLPLNRFEPYIGAGPAVYFSEITSGNQSAAAVVPGLNVIAGTRFFLFKYVALFTEYKFNYAKFDFEDDNIQLQGTYMANQFHGGLSIHFR